MLGLPSTTEVGRRLPKEAFYKRLKLDAKTRDEFVQLIERLTIANSLKPGTANVADGQKVHEVLVLEVAMKGSEAPTRALEAIAKANVHELVFALTPTDEVWLWSNGELVEASHPGDLAIRGATMDEVWDSFRAQLLFGSLDGTAVERRIELAREVAALEREVATLDKRCRKERQIAKRNALFEQVRAKRRELEQARSQLGQWE